MNNKKYTFLALVIGSGLAIIMADFLILLFFENTFSQLRFRFGIPALAFLALYCLILGRSARYFDYTYFTKLDGKHYLLWLKKIEVAPIKGIALNVVSHAVFLGIVFSGNYLGINPAVKGQLFLALLSFGMLLGTFILVAEDNLISSALFAHNFTGYPNGCRERRQEAKAWVVPIAAVLDTLLFYELGEADGYYGPMTEAVIKKIQDKYGLPVTEIVDNGQFMYSIKMICYFLNENDCRIEFRLSGFDQFMKDSGYEEENGNIYYIINGVLYRDINGTKVRQDDEHGILDRINRIKNEFNAKYR